MYSTRMIVVTEDEFNTDNAAGKSWDDDRIILYELSFTNVLTFFTCTYIHPVGRVA